MKFGLALPTAMEGLINPIPFFEPSDFVRLGRVAEEIGYDAIWGNDHYAPQDYVRQKHADPPNFYEVLTVLAAVAGATERIELGTSVLVMPMRDIVTMTRQVATLDQVSNGRVLLGVSIGAYREEYQAARPDIFRRHRGRALDEGLELFGRLTTERSVTHDGEYYSVTELELDPKPLRSPFPLLIGGHSLKAIDRAVAHGLGWIPGWRPFGELREWIGILRERTAAAGRDPREMIAAPNLSCLLGRTHEEAERAYMASGMVQHRISLAKTGRDPSLAMDNNLVGGPAEVLEKVQFLHDAGADHISCITMCVNTVAEYEEQMHWLIDEVIAPYRRANGIRAPGADVLDAERGAP